MAITQGDDKGPDDERDDERFHRSPPRRAFSTLSKPRVSGGRANSRTRLRPEFPSENGVGRQSGTLEVFIDREQYWCQNAPRGLASC